MEDVGVINVRLFTWSAGVYFGKDNSGYSGEVTCDLEIGAEGGGGRKWVSGDGSKDRQ